MFKKILFVCGMACALLANAQSSKFDGASIGLNMNNSTLAAKYSEGGDSFTLGETSTNANIQGAYSFSLSEQALFSIGGTYALGEIKAGSVNTPTVRLTGRAKNFYSIYVEPAFVNENTAFYGKLAYIATKSELVVAGLKGSADLTGTGYGVGIRTLLDKNIYLQVEFMDNKFKSKTITIDANPVNIEPAGTVGTVGIGYKF